MIPASEALERLRQVNRRFMIGVRSTETLSSKRQREEFVSCHTSFAVILGYANSRVPILLSDEGIMRAGGD